MARSNRSGPVRMGSQETSLPRPRTPPTSTKVRAERWKGDACGSWLRFGGRRVALRAEPSKPWPKAPGQARPAAFRARAPSSTAPTPWDRNGATTRKPLGRQAPVELDVLLALHLPGEVL